MIRFVLVTFACSSGSGGVDADLPDPSGRACVSGADLIDPTVVASPALECASRVCVHLHGLSPDLCTAECTQASDCVIDAASACTVGFACAPVVSVGPFACKAMCVCADRVPITSC